MNTDQGTLGRTSRDLHGRYPMTPSNSLTYVINFRDSANCSRVQNAQPGEEILVLVHPEQEPDVGAYCYYPPRGVFRSVVP